jgi:UDP-2,4-diacetamido-2,4,6-trideoxy-beta-L-altropyranose hydrolase
MNETLIIRADASSRTGTGHVMRCLALAQEWRRTGGSVAFVQCETTAALTRRLDGEAIETVAIHAVPGSPEDAALTAEHARRLGASWVVADGYVFGELWQTGIKQAGCRLLLTDDYGHAEAYSADLILNQNLHAEAGHYAPRAPRSRLLLGPGYAQLRKEFAAWRDWNREFPASADKLLVTLGGGDPDNATASVLRALAKLPGIEVRVVVGGDNPHRPAIEAMAAGLGRSFTLLFAPENMPELMAWADLAISAGGSTSWELAFMGLPAIAIAIADNQRPIVQSLARAGCAIDAGWFQDLDEAALAKIVQNLRAAPSIREDMSRRQRKLVDGHGARRILAAVRKTLGITILSDRDSWINRELSEWVSQLREGGHRVEWIHSWQQIGEGDLAFFLSYSRVVPPAVLRRNAQNLVVHESDLPRGRGWSPLAWQVLAGENKIPITLLEAVENVDSGPIYFQDTLTLSGAELVDELRIIQAGATVRLCREFVAGYPFVLADARPQSGDGTFYRRRRPADSKLDPDLSLREQFQLLRIADFERYPAFFEMAGRRYAVRLTPLPDENEK